MSVMIVRTCDCVHKYQDELLGKFKRWMNRQTKSESARCTVCGKVHKI